MLAVVLIIVGLLISFGAFAYAAMNMASAFTDHRKHLRAMVVMAFGGLVTSIGVVLGGWQVVQKLLE